MILFYLLISGGFLLSVPPHNAPEDFTHRAVSGVQGSVYFSWNPPVHTTSVILYYNITCTSTEDSRIVYNSSSYLNVTLSSLTPNAYYMCTISASTAGGEGPQSDPIHVLTGELKSTCTCVARCTTCTGMDSSLHF